MLVFPGFIDAHTHFDLHVAGTVTVDDFASGTMAEAAGGTTSNTIDTFTVSIDARAETDAEAYDTLATVLGLLETQSQNQEGALRNVSINSLARWGNDPARPDLKLCTATVLVTAHRIPFEII